MRINTNTAAMNTYSRLTSAQRSQSNSLAKLSSGLRINKAGDDAAGLSISEKMRNQISGLAQATRNAQDGISLIQTAEGALNETHSILNRMRDLTLQAKNGTNTEDDLGAIQDELQSLVDEINNVAGTTTFNTQNLLNGDEAIGGTTETTYSFNIDSGAGFTEAQLETAWDASSITDEFSAEAFADLDPGQLADLVTALNDIEEVSDVAVEDLEGIVATDTITVPGDTTGTSFTFQIGANKGETLTLSIGNNSASGLGLEGLDLKGAAEIPNTSEDLDNPTEGSFDDILGKIDAAISSVSAERANLGANQNRLEHTINNLTTTRENLAEANSRIRDVDMAEEMMEFTKNNILSQASTAMLAQANQLPQGVLQLLQ